MTTPPDLRDRLPELLDELAESIPIDDTDSDFDPYRVRVVTVPHDRRRPVVAVLGAAAASMLLVGGLVVAANRSEPPGPAAPITTQPVEPAEPSPAAPGVVDPTDMLDNPGGALTFDSPPTGFTLTHAQADRFADDEWEIRTRFYTADPERPDTAATFAVTTMPADAFSTDIPSDATVVTVGTIEASLYDDPHTGHRTLTYQSGDQLYTITGYQVTDDEIITVALHTGPAGPGYDDFGAVVDPDGLPAGVEEVHTGGSWFEQWFISQNTLTYPIAMVHWESDTASLWTISLFQNPRWFPLTLIGWDTITDTTVRGEPAFIVTTASDPEFLGVHWIGGNTHMVGSRGLDESELIELVEQLRPATDTEWDDMVATSEAPVTVSADIEAWETAIADIVEATGWDLINAEYGGLNGGFEFSDGTTHVEIVIGPPEWRGVVIDPDVAGDPIPEGSLFVVEATATDPARVLIVVAPDNVVMADFSPENSDVEVVIDAARRIANVSITVGDQTS